MGSSFDVAAKFRCKDRELKKNLHHAVVSREKLFEDKVLEIGEGEFDSVVWEKVVLFLYSGYINCRNRTEFAELSNLVESYNVVCLQELIQAEKELIEQEDAEFLKQAKEEGKQNVVLPERTAFMDGSQQLQEYVLSLLENEKSGDFSIHCEDDVSLNVHACLLGRLFTSIFFF